MEKYDWYEYLKVSKEKKDEFIGVIIGTDNVVKAYSKGEERKYKIALKKHEQEVVNV